MSALAQWLPTIAFPSLAWAGVASVSVPLVIHLLTRLRRRPVPWGAMRFLVEAFRRQRHRLRLEQFLLLLVRCLILAVLGLALSGPVLDAAGVLGGSPLAAGRVLIVVVDDSLTTHTVLTGDTNRFDRLVGLARRLIGALGPSDRVSIWRAARPPQQVVGSTIDHAAALRALGEMKPRFSRSDLSNTVELVCAQLSDLDAAKDVFVAVLSDLARDTLDMHRRPTAEQADRSGGAIWILSEPMVPADNLQIMSLRPLRRLILTDQTGRASLPVELFLRRFAAEAPSASTQIELTAMGSAFGRASLTRVHKWTPGERTAPPLHLTLQLRPNAPGPPEAAATLAVVRARVLSSQGELLRADDERVVLVELRRRLAVALIDNPAAAPSNRFTAHRWLSAALAPRVGQFDEAADSISLVNVPTEAVDAEQLRHVQAALVLRPDMVDRAGWQALRQFAAGGGLVSVFVPAVETPAAWAPSMAEGMGVNWQLGLEPLESEQPWFIASDEAPPSAFDQLTADWQALLRPVRVHKRLALSVESGGLDVWLRLADDEQSPWLAAASVGDGAVTVLASALDTAWTNLTTKPIWPPLVHELLRGVLGQTGEAQRLAKLVAGDRPTLGRRWQRVKRLVTTGVHGVGDAGGAGEQLDTAVVPTKDGLSTTEPLERPGVYTTAPPTGLMLAVNVDAEAGDTQSLEKPQVSEWFASLGAWRWLSADQPEAVLAAQTRRMDVSWPLLWITLGLVLVETWLARWFSHARAVGAPAWFGSRIGLDRGEG